MAVAGEMKSKLAADECGLSLIHNQIEAPRAPRGAKEERTSKAGVRSQQSWLLTPVFYHPLLLLFFLSASLRPWRFSSICG
jgi:hypothetical protein